MTQKVKNIWFHIIEILLIGLVVFLVSFLINTNNSDHSEMKGEIKDLEKTVSDIRDSLDEWIDVYILD